MSRCRKLSSDISCDKVVARCGRKSLLAALLYTWMIPHLDDWGRITGDPEELGMIVMPGFYQSPEEIENALQILHEEELIDVYEAEGKQCIAYPLRSFWKYQTYISEKSTRAGSKFPDPPGFVLPQKQESGKVRESAGKREEVRESAGKCASFSFPSSFKPSFKKDLKTESTPPISPPRGSSSTSDEQVCLQTESSPKKKTKIKPTNSEYSPDFLTFWEAYPRKDEKGKAWQAWLARLKEGAKPDQLILAARNYANSIAGKDRLMMKLPATLLGPGHGPGGADPIWQEWQKTRSEFPKSAEIPGQTPADTDLSDYPTEREVDPVALEASRAKLKAIFSDLGQAKAMPQ